MAASGQFLLALDIAAGRLLPGQGDIRDVRPRLVRGDRPITAALMGLRGGEP